MMLSNMQIWRGQQWPQDWKRSILIPIPKKGNTKECSNHQTITFIFHASMVMLKILQARLQDYMKRTSRCSRWVQKRQRNQRSNCQHFLDHRKQWNSRRTSTSVSVMLKPLTVWIITNCGKLLKRWVYRPSYLPPEKSVCGSGSNSQNPVWNN